MRPQLRQKNHLNLINISTERIDGAQFLDSDAQTALAVILLAFQLRVGIQTDEVGCRSFPSFTCTLVLSVSFSPAKNQFSG